MSISLKSYNSVDNRMGVDRRQFAYTAYIPERRSGKSRRSDDHHHHAESRDTNRLESINY